MRPILRKESFTVTLDQHFRRVMQNCQSTPRPGQQGTWITEEMIEAYCELHRQGLAHSVEVWHEKQLVGGLYGVSLGNAFFGESMFAHVSNASKVGFIYLVKGLAQAGFSLIDCQVYTKHLASLGGENIERKVFMEQLTHNLAQPTLQGNWQELLDWPPPLSVILEKETQP